MRRPKIIAIDGPAASGKSTAGEKLADLLGYFFFDTGVMYRAVTWAAMTYLGDVNNEAEVSALAQRIQIDVREPTINDKRQYDVLVDGVDATWEIRRADVEANVSVVAAYPVVRKCMTEQQRRIGNRGLTVMVGRDIGTVVFPEAELKIFLDASVEERARRRCEENRLRGEPANYAETLAAMSKRDKKDSTRRVAPAVKAEDAIVINTDHTPVEKVVQMVLEKLE
jgi:cytidylate kinase